MHRRAAQQLVNPLLAETGVFDVCDVEVDMSEENLWQQAAGSSALWREEHQVVDTRYRNSERIL